MSVLPNQNPGVLEEHGLSRAEADRSVWVIARDGRRWEGAGALNRILLELGRGWALLSLAYRLRPVAALEEAAYRWLARNRGRFHRFGVPPEVGPR